MGGRGGGKGRAKEGIGIREWRRERKGCKVRAWPGLPQPEGRTGSEGGPIPGVGAKGERSAIDAFSDSLIDGGEDREPC